MTCCLPPRVISAVFAGSWRHGQALGAACAALALALAPAAGQSPDSIAIPLKHVAPEDDESSFDSLGIMIGINAADPRLYLLDTGSDMFLGQFDASIAGLEPPHGSKPDLYGYGDGTYGYWKQDVQFGEMSFYDPDDPREPVVTIPGKHLAGRIIDWVYSKQHNGYEDYRTSSKPVGRRDGTWFYADLDVRDRIANDQPSDHPPFYGTYGAADFTSEKKYSAAPGSQTQTGYVVAANANLGDVETPGCAPCLNLHLTPNLRAQFTALMPWGELDYEYTERQFTGSGANASNVHDGNFRYTISAPVGRKKRTIDLTGPILFDTGTQEFVLVDSVAVVQQFTAHGYRLNEYEQDVVDIKFYGFEDRLNDLEYEDVTIGRLSGEEDSAAITIGLPFFHQNSVMYDLENRITGYSPFFVTIGDFSTDRFSNDKPYLGHVDENIGSWGWLGLAGTLSGAGDLVLEENVNVRLTGINTYTGATRIASGSALHLAGPGSISLSERIVNEGLFYINQKGAYHQAWGVDRADEDTVIRDITGSGNILLGPNRLILTAASGQVDGPITDRDAEGNNSGGGLVVVGGKLTLAGDSDYSGLTEIGANGELHVTGALTGDVAVYGRLIVDGTVDGQVTVHGGGSVSGTGTVGDLAVQPGGSATQMRIAPTD